MWWYFWLALRITCTHVNSSQKIFDSSTSLTRVNSNYTNTSPISTTNSQMTLVHWIPIFFTLHNCLTLGYVTLLISGCHRSGCALDDITIPALHVLIENKLGSVSLKAHFPSCYLLMMALKISQKELLLSLSLPHIMNMLWNHYL